MKHLLFVVLALFASVALATPQDDLFKAGGEHYMTVRQAGHVHKAALSDCLIDNTAAKRKACRVKADADYKKATVAADATLKAAQVKADAAEVAASADAAAKNAKIDADAAAAKAKK